ncbi:ABC transporter substrate-binding protein [Paenibacillus oceani]|uniref:Extracellular solute-binding protein n=1 Tax=Paenibacillus oceani TaxID=2772510 RepID=A0A927C8T5_9BACL|nr:extracellular solute-binding protein [Paenibacillus oceani]MBD2863503.1 extracellular solute-binding protein [Paenibacillus oceani]
MNKTVLMKGVMCAFLTIALTACAAGQKSAEPGPSGGAADAEVKQPKPPEPVDITVFSINRTTEDAFNKQYGEAIRSKFPHVNLKVVVNGKGTGIPELIGSNTPIDILYGSVEGIFTNVIDYKLQYDITGLIQSRKYDLNKLEPSIVELQRKLSGGKLYGLPVWTATSGLFYNKDLFDKFGQPYPKEGMTWDELAELSKKMTRLEDGVQYYGYVTGPGAQMATNQLGLDPIDPVTMKSNFTSEPWKQFMQSIVDIYKASGLAYKADELDVAKSRAAFEKESRVAMYTNYSGGTPPETMNWDVVSVPSYKNAPGKGPQVYPNYWYVSGISKHKEAAFDIIAFLSSDEFQIPHNRKGYATVLKDEAIKKQYGQDMPKFKGKNVAAMFPKQPAPAMNYTPYVRNAQNVFQSAFQKHMLEGIDLNTVMREAAEQLDKQVMDAQGK